MLFLLEGERTCKYFVVLVNIRQTCIQTRKLTGGSEKTRLGDSTPPSAVEQVLHGTQNRFWKLYQDYQHRHASERLSDFPQATQRQGQCPLPLSTSFWPCVGLTVLSFNFCF